MFDEFWKLYPRKVSKRVAQKIWERMPKEEQEAAHVLCSHRLAELGGLRARVWGAGA
jgi:hypothetical protein